MEKRILMVETGGTIAAEMTEAGLAPGLRGTDLLAYVPDLRHLCRVDCLQVFSIDSTNMTPDHWLTVARAIQERYGDYDGFVVCHGTDTMAYTAAALSYLIQDSPKPIVITGSQKSIALNDTDARRNLYDSFLYAADKQSHDVSLVFDGRVILGTRARKERSKSFNAFSCVDYPERAVIRDGKLIRYLAPRPYAYGAEPVFYDRLEEKVLLLTLIPGMGAEALRLLKDSYQAVILQSFGVGGLPGGGDGPLAQAAAEWLAEGKTIVMMTQVPYEGSDMSVYQVGQQVKERFQLMEAYNMTLEAATAKLMWVLGQTRDPERVRELFYHPVQFDVIR